MLDAPVKSPDYQSITFNDNCQLGIRPHGEGGSSDGTLALKGECELAFVLHAVLSCSC